MRLISAFSMTVILHILEFKVNIIVLISHVEQNSGRREKISANHVIRKKGNRNQEVLVNWRLVNWNESNPGPRQEIK